MNLRLFFEINEFVTFDLPFIIVFIYIYDLLLQYKKNTNVISYNLIKKMEVDVEFSLLCLAI